MLFLQLRRQDLNLRPSGYEANIALFVQKSVHKNRKNGAFGAPFLYFTDILLYTLVAMCLDWGQIGVKNSSVYCFFVIF